MQRYSVGFLFNGDGSKVVLIRKKRPTWQKGLLNGVGGHVEEGESHLDAMIREFEEEAGVKYAKWHYYVTLGNDERRCLFFFGFAPPHIFNSVKSMTDEVIGTYNVDKLPKATVPNLQWLVPMALSMQNDRADWFSITEGRFAEPAQGELKEAA